MRYVYPQTRPHAPPLKANAVLGMRCSYGKWSRGTRDVMSLAVNMYVTKT